jgi:hypothetical protein
MALQASRPNKKGIRKEVSDIYEESISQHSTSDVDCDSRAEHHPQDNDSSALTLQSDDLYKSEERNN